MNQNESKEEIIEKLIRNQKAILKRTIDAYRRNGEQGHNWYIFCVFYFSALDNLIPNISEATSEETDYQDNKGIIIPSIFLFRHTLELILKFLQVNITKKVNNSHDIEEIRKDLTLEKVRDSINWAKASTDIGSSTDKLKTIFNEQYPKVEDMVEDYFFGIFLQNNYPSFNFVVIDKQNELFKYPINNNVNVQFDPLSLYEINAGVIQKLKKDHKILKSIFIILSYSGF